MIKEAYLHADEVSGANLAAQRIVPLILELTPEVRSVVDVGGGTGAWLQAFQKLGIETIQLYDALEVAPGLLIEPSCFQPINLNEGLPAQDSFDLAICLECAEHLHADRALPLVKWLTSTADIVIFSAAVPGQPGKGHINVQPLEYWQKLFRQCDYVCHDLLRGQIIDDFNIPYWYRQNLCVFTKPTVSLVGDAKDFLPSDFVMVHREVMEYYYHPSLRILLHELGGALVKAIRYRLGFHG